MRKAKVYSANYRCNTTLLVALKESFLQAKTYQWQILLAIKKQIQATYAQDVFGLFWSIVMPIIPMTVYMILAQIKVFNTSSEMPFVYYIAIGMMVWLLMASIIQKVMTSIKGEKSILTTTNFPIFASMLSQLGGVLHDTGIRLMAIAIIVVWYHLDVSFAAVALTLLALLPAIIFAFALGMILSILDIVIQDTRRLVDIFLRYGLFVSSVIFPFPTDGMIGFVNQFNFFNTYVNAVRNFLYYSETANLDIFLYTSAFGVVLLMVAMKLVYNMDYKIRAYL